MAEEGPNTEQATKRKRNYTEEEVIASAMELTKLQIIEHMKVAPTDTITIKLVKYNNRIMIRMAFTPDAREN